MRHTSDQLLIVNDHYWVKSPVFGPEKGQKCLFQHENSYLKSPKLSKCLGIVLEWKEETYKTYICLIDKC